MASFPIVTYSMPSIYLRHHSPQWVLGLETTLKRYPHSSVRQTFVVPCSFSSFGLNKEHNSILSLRGCLTFDSPAPKEWFMSNTKLSTAFKSCDFAVITMLQRAAFPAGLWDYNFSSSSSIFFFSPFVAGFENICNFLEAWNLHW